MMGIKKEWRGLGIAQALTGTAFSTMIRRGYQSASYTLLVDENTATRRVIKKMGGVAERNYVAYRKTLK